MTITNNATEIEPVEGTETVLEAETAAPEQLNTRKATRTNAITRFNCNVPGCGAKNVPAGDHLRKQHDVPIELVEVRNGNGRCKIPGCTVPKGMTSVEVYLHLWPEHPDQFKEGAEWLSRRFNCPACDARNILINHLHDNHQLPVRSIHFEKTHGKCNIPECFQPNIPGGRQPGGRQKGADHLFDQHRGRFKNVTVAGEDADPPKDPILDPNKDTIEGPPSTNSPGPLSTFDQGFELVRNTFRATLEQTLLALEAAQQEIEYWKKENQAKDEQFAGRDQAKDEQIVRRDDEIVRLKKHNEYLSGKVAEAHTTIIQLEIHQHDKEKANEVLEGYFRPTG